MCLIERGLLQKSDPEQVKRKNCTVEKENRTFVVKTII